MAKKKVTKKKTRTRSSRPAAKAVQDWIVDTIRELQRSKPETLVQRRYEKLRKIGAIAWHPPGGGPKPVTVDERQGGTYDSQIPTRQ